MPRRRIIPYDSSLKPIARSLRKRMTDAGRKLWSVIRKKQIYGLQFLRQRPIGRYIVDFCCPEAKLVIEVDGGQHYQEEGKSADIIRDAFLKSQGLRVLRFSNLDVLQNIEGVVQFIMNDLDKHPLNPPQGGNKIREM